jgi:hypothetical protein
MHRRIVFREELSGRRNRFKFVLTIVSHGLLSFLRIIADLIASPGNNLLLLQPLSRSGQPFHAYSFSPMTVG